MEKSVAFRFFFKHPYYLRDSLVTGEFTLGQVSYFKSSSVEVTPL